MSGRRAFFLPQGGGSKYHSKKAIVDGRTFDSIKEARRYAELKMLENAGEISGLECQVKFVLIPTQREPDDIGPLNADDVTAEWEKISEKTASPYSGENALRRPVFDLADGTAYTPSDEKVAEWIKAFPQLDVEKCLREAAAKNNAHSGQDMRRRKNALTVEPYIVNWLIVESGQAEKAAKERRRNGFSDMPEHGDEITVEELRERNGNLI